MNAVSRRALSAAIPALLAVGVAGFPSAAHAADPAPSEVAVVPADSEPTSAYEPTDYTALAGTTGFLHRHTAAGSYMWTSYDGHASRVVPELTGKTWYSAGGDEVYLTGSNTGFPATVVPVLNLATGGWRLLDRDGATGPANVAGDHMLIRATLTTAVPDLRTYAADGTYRTTPITVFGTEVPYNIGLRTADARTAVVSLAFQKSGAAYGLLDLASGHIVQFPKPPGTVNRYVLTEDRVVAYGATTAWVYSRAEAEAGTATAPLADYGTMALGSTITSPSAVLVGDKFVVVDAFGVTRVYSPDGTSTVIAGQTNGSIVQASDDTGVVSRGTGPTDWAFRRFTPDGSDLLLPLYGRKLVVGGLTLANGTLRREEVVPQPGENATQYWTATSAATSDAKPALQRVINTPITCGPTCLHTVADETRSLYLLSFTGSTTLLGVQSTGDGYRSTLPSAGGTLVDAGYGWVVVNGTGPSNQYVTQTGHTTAITRTLGAAAISFDTLWSAPKAGTLQPQALGDDGNLGNSGLPGAEISTGSNCTPTEIQATNRYVYWTCGVSGPAGAYDLTAAKNFTVPAADYELGDGYLVHHDANGDLVRNTVTGGTFGAPAKLATFARGTGDERNITWTADKFGGDVAWVDASGATHIVDPAVPPSPVALGALAKPSRGDTVEVPYDWTATAYLTGPVDSWKATFTQVSSGKLAYTTSGGRAVGTLPFSWNGLVDGKRQPAATTATRCR